jgi:predicted transcriptional regulator of viral defense system
MEMYRELEQLGNVPFGADVLMSMMEGTKAPGKKLSYLDRQGKIIRLKKGMYVAAPEASRKEISACLVANHIYGPSYVSCHTALRHWGLIPERVYSIQSMTVKRSRSFQNSIGRFEYIHASEDYYPIGITTIREDGISYLIASPEKALCDLIVSTSYLNLRYRQELLQFLDEDLRLDMDEFRRMDSSIFHACANVSKKHTMIDNLAKLLKQ